MSETEPVFLKFCSILRTETKISSDKFYIDNKSLICSDSNSNSSDMYSFQFHHIFPNETHGEDTINSSYKIILDPLVRDVIDGESVLSILCGSPHLDSSKFLPCSPSYISHGKAKNISYVIKAATQLLEASEANSHSLSTNKTTATLSLTWCKIDCKNAEAVIDVLKNASTGHKGPTNGLNLRDMGKGRGMTVPGLTEVAFTSAEELEALITQVLNTQSDLSPDISSHTVMQLIFTPNNSKSSSSNTSTHNKTLALLEPLGTGRLTFFVMSGFNEGPSSNNNNAVNSNRKVNFAWVDALPEVLEILELGLTQPKFSSTKTLMFLKEALCGRQRASLMLHLKPEEKTLSNQLMWLELVDHLGLQKSKKVIKNSSFLSNKPDVPQSANRQSIHNSNEKSKKLLSSNAPSTVSLSKSNRKNSIIMSHSTTTTTTTTPKTDYKPSLDSSNILNTNSSTTTSISAANNKSVYSTPLSIPPTPTPTTTPVNQRNNHHQHQHTSSKFDNAIEPRVVTNDINSYYSKDKDQSNKTPRNNLDMNKSPSISSSPTPMSLKQIWAAGDRFSEPNDYEKFKKERYLLESEAVAESRREVLSVKRELEEVQLKYQACKEAFEKLLEELKAEGTTLQLKDKERLRKSLNDLRDYELYKGVMETTLLRMQAELTSMAEENNQLRYNYQQAKLALQKQKSMDCRNDKELAEALKKIATFEEEINQLKSERNKATKDRDAAVTTLVKVKSEAAKKSSSMLAELKKKDDVIVSLKKKLADITDKFKYLGEEKKAVEQAFANEVKSLRLGNSKTLEMLLGYHEENENLRLAFGEIAGDNDSEKNKNSSSVSKSANLNSASSSIVSETNYEINNDEKIDIESISIEDVDKLKIEDLNST